MSLQALYCELFEQKETVVKTDGRARKEDLPGKGMLAVLAVTSGILDNS